MLAVYLAVPESENTKHALNTMTGMRLEPKSLIVAHLKDVLTT